MKLFIGLGVMSSIVTSKPTVASRSGALIEKDVNDSLLQTTSDTFEFDFFPGTTSSSITFPDEFGAWASTLPELKTSAPAFPELFETTPSMSFPELSTTESVEPIFPESTVGPTSNLAATENPLDIFSILATTDGLVFPPDMFTTAPDIFTTADTFDYKSLENEIPDSEFLETTPLLPVELETNSVTPITTMTAKIVSPSIKTTTTLGNQVDTSMTSTTGRTSSTNQTSMITTTSSNASTTKVAATTSTTSISMQSSSSIATSTLVIIPVNSTVVPDTSTLSTSTVDASTLTSTTHVSTTTIEGNDTVVTVAPVVEETTAALPTETTSSSNSTDATTDITTTLTTTTKAGASATTGSFLSTLVFIILLLID
jgi:hypothetical protein